MLLPSAPGNQHPLWEPGCQLLLILFILPFSFPLPTGIAHTSSPRAAFQVPASNSLCSALENGFPGSPVAFPSPRSGRGWFYWTGSEPPAVMATLQQVPHAAWDTLSTRRCGAEHLITGEELCEQHHPRQGMLLPLDPCSHWKCCSRREFCRSQAL